MTERGGEEETGRGRVGERMENGKGMVTSVR